MGQRLFKPVPNELRTFEEIARGSYGTIYRGSLKGVPVAIKQLHPSLVGHATRRRIEEDEEITYAMKAFSTECNLLKENRHENLLHFVGLFDNNSGLPLLVTELMRESLTDYLTRKDSNLDEQRKIRMCLDIAKGLAFLHGLYPLVLHRDLTSSNILIGFADQVKIGDLGQAKLLDLRQKLGISLTTAPGNISYMPPEALVHNPYYSDKLDVFSEGVIYLQVMCERPAPRVLMIGIGTVPEIERRKEDLDMIGDHHPMKSIITRCLQDDPNSRPSAQEVCNLIADVSNKHVCQEDFNPTLLNDSRCRLYWKKCPDLPVATRFATVLVHNFKVYVCGGGMSEVTLAPSIQIFHTLQNRWEVRPNAPQFCCEVAMIDDQIILIGGQDTSTWEITNKVSTLIEDNEDSECCWSNKYPPLPDKLFRPGTTYHNGVLVVAGGFSGTNHALSNSVHLLATRESHGVLHQSEREHLQWYTIPGLRLPFAAHCFSVCSTLDHLVLINHYRDRFFISKGVICCKWADFHRVVSGTIPQLGGSINETIDDLYTQISRPLWAELSDIPLYRSSFVPCGSSIIALGGTDDGRGHLQEIYTLDASQASPSWNYVRMLNADEILKPNCSAVGLSPTSFLVIGGCSNPNSWRTSMCNEVFLVHM